MEKAEFFSKIFGKQEGLVVLTLPNFVGKPTNDFWFQYPEELDKMSKFADDNWTKSVYYSPIVYKERQRKLDAALTTQVLGADADACDPNNFRIQPSITVETSPGRWQVYFLLEEPIDAHYASKVNRRISRSHLDEGCDPSYINAAKLMRVPGTTNQKYVGSLVNLASDDSHIVYSVEHIAETAYTVEDVPDADYGNYAADMPENIGDYIAENRVQLLNKIPNGLPQSPEIKNLLFTNYVEGKRSEARWKLIYLLIDLGFDDIDVMALVWGAPSNKYEDDNRSYAGLWAEVIKARGQYELEKKSLEDVNPDEVSDEVVIPMPSKPRETYDFLTSEEREDLPPTFVDEWVTWAKTKTDALEEYHRATAIALMSTIYSQFAAATPAFGPLKLNLWLMVLGRTSEDRKSTARGYGLKAIKRLTDENYQYEVGGDSTPQGITAMLSDRPFKSSALWRDEAQGWFKELFGQTYQSGAMEMFTALYDGYTLGRVRAAGEKKIQPSVDVSFILYLTGILQETTDMLTVGNFKSGFLARFVYTIAERPDGWEPSSLPQAPEGGEIEDVVFNSLVNQLGTSRNYWSMIVEEGKMFALRADDDAWERWQAFEREAKRMAREHSLADLIRPTTERMTLSVLKLAGLFAMHERKKRIGLKHMLSAIAYAGGWFRDALIMAGGVSDTLFNKDVSKLETLIVQRGGRLAYSTAYSHKDFTGKRPFEFEELVTALENRGVLHREPNGNKVILVIDYGE